MPGEVAADRETGLPFQEFGCHLSHLVGGQRVRSDRRDTANRAVRALLMVALSLPLAPLGALFCTFLGPRSKMETMRGRLMLRSRPGRSRTLGRR